MEPIQAWTLAASIIGASAWIPPIVSAIRSHLSKPKVTIIPSGICSIGFTELGPIFNLNVAITADDKNVLIRCIDLELTHESGSRQLFRWHELIEDKGTMLGAGGESQTLTHHSEAIAMKILPADFKSLSLRNRVLSVSDRIRSFNSEWAKNRRILSNNDRYNPDTFYLSPLIQEIQNFLVANMNWTKGNYSVEFHIKTSTESIIDAPKLNFSLTDDDIVLLGMNRDNIPRFIRNLCLFETPQATNIQPLQWHWIEKNIRA